MPSPPTPLPRTGEGNLTPSVGFDGTLPPGPEMGPARNTFPPGDPYVPCPRAARARHPSVGTTRAHAASLRSSRRRGVQARLSPRTNRLRESRSRPRAGPEIEGVCGPTVRDYPHRRFTAPRDGKANCSSPNGSVNDIFWD